MIDINMILTDFDVGQVTIVVNPSYNGRQTKAVGFEDILNSLSDLLVICNNDH